MFWTKCQFTAIIKLQVPFVHVHECAYIKYHQLYLTFSLHVIDQFRTEPLTADFLLQVKRPPAINLFIRDAIVMVMSPGTSALYNENEVHNLSSHLLTYSFHSSFLPSCLECYFYLHFAIVAVILMNQRLNLPVANVFAL